MTTIFLFIANGAIMILEIVGARAIAPYLGTSTEVWAGLIATVLAGLTVGYHFGGKVADKVISKGGSLHKLVAHITIVSGIFILISWLLIDFFAGLGIILAGNLGLTASACIIALFAFVPATIGLSSLSPIIAKIRIKNLSGAGSVVGSLSAISAFGSIVGSLSAGIILIPYFGSRETLIWLGILLCVMASGYSIFHKSWKKPVVVLGGILVLVSLIKIYNTLFIEVENGNKVASSRLVADIDTRYQRLWIIDSIDSHTGREVRSVHTDPFATQCAMYKDEIKTNSNVTSLVFSYTKAFDEALKHLTSQSAPKNITVVGGCNYSYPSHLSKNYPNTHITVSELDPKLEEISKNLFNFQKPENMSIVNGDARNFFASRKNAGQAEKQTQKQTEKTDIIFYDAYNTSSAIPFQLVTIEAFKDVEKHLTEEGYLIINAIGGLSGETGEVTSSIFASLKRVFANVSIYQINNAPFAQPQNMLIIASNGEIGIDQSQSYLSLVDSGILPADPIILTDNFAPIERLSKPIRDLAMMR